MHRKENHSTATSRRKPLLEVVDGSSDEGSSEDACEESSPVDEMPSCPGVFFSQILPRLMTREQLIKRFWMRCSIRPGKDAGLKNLFSLQGMTADPLAFVDDPGEWVRSDSFFWGVSRISHLGYNLLYLSLLSADLIELLMMPLTTYLSSPVQVLLGTAQNKEPYDASLTSVLGDDRPDTVGFWVGIICLYVLPIVAGVVAARLRANIDKIGELLDRIVRYHGREKNIFKLVRFSYLYERLKVADDRRELIAGALENSRTYRKDAHCFSRLTATYLQWSLGISRRASDHVGFNLTVTPFSLLAWWNYRRMLIMKIMVVIGYAINRVKCQSIGYYFSWLKELGIYRCDPCQSSAVDVKSRHSVEGCVNRTLAYPRPLDTLIDELRSFVSKLPYLKEFKLSYQNWTQFSQIELSYFLGELSGLLPTIQSLDLSTDEPIALTVWQASLMAQFLNNMTSLDTFDSSGIVWPNRSISLLSEAISGLGIQTLVLDNTHLNATGLYYWTNAALENLEYLSCAQSSFLFNESESNLLPNLPAIRHVGFSNSAFNQRNLDTISAWLANVTAETLVFSGVNLEQLNTSLLFLASNSSQNVQFSGCNLADSDLSDIAKHWVNTSITQLDLSDNGFSYLGFLQLRKIVLALEELSIAYNDMTGSIFDLCQWLQGSAITTLNTAGVLLSLNDQQTLFDAIANSSITNLIFSDMGLTDDLVLYASSMFQSNLSAWDLSNNRLTNTSLSAVMSAVPGTQMRSLLLGGNDLIELIASDIWAGLVGNQSVLQVLELRSTQLNDENALRLMKSLGFNSTLKKLLWGYNTFDGSTFRELNQRLRRGPDYLLSLNENETDNVDYNYDNYMNARQNNQLEVYEIAGIPTSVAIGCELCQALAYMITLNITGVIFDKDQLALSSQVGIDGCPEATSASSALSPSFFLMMAVLLLNLYASSLSTQVPSKKKTFYRSNLYELDKPLMTTTQSAARR